VNKETLYKLINEVLEEMTEETKKDACYHKVKSRYKVWPSAYASGALVKCRKVGAKNWGNSKKEGMHEDEGPSKKDLEKILKDEGGAAGMSAFTDKFGKDKEKEIKDMLADMSNVGQHKDKDYILHDDKEIRVVKQENKKKSGASNINARLIVKIQRDSRKKPIALVERKDPKVGTGKKPKGSGRRLYTDEDPSDTVSVKFSTAQDIRDTLSKESFKSKSHKRQSQIINLIHQRVRAAYNNAKDPKVKSRLKRALDYAEDRKEASKRKTQRMNKKDEVIDLEEKCQKGYKTHPTQKTKEMFGKTYRNCVKAEENQELEEKKKKAGTESSKESSLSDWFGRKGAKGKKKGWVDCNAPDGKGGYKACGRESGEKRKKYPACRPTPGACKERGKGKSWGKKAKKNKNEGLDIDMRKGLLYEGDESILEEFKGATLDGGGLVCEACLFEMLQEASCGCPGLVGEAEYQGRKVTLNKPMRGDVKKFKVYVKDPKTGNIKKVNFGHGGTSAKAKGEKTMKIRKSNPKARKSFRARHNCDNPGPKTKARYWSCKKW